jgi:hypothetical protein
MCDRVPHVILLSLTYFQTSIFLSNHSVYLQNSELQSVCACLPTCVLVCLSVYLSVCLSPCMFVYLSVSLPLKSPAACNVLTVGFIGNNSKQVVRSRGKNSVLSYRLSVLWMSKLLKKFYINKCY